MTLWGFGVRASRYLLFIFLFFNLFIIIYFILLVHLVESIHFSFTLIVLKSNVEEEPLPLM